MPTPPAISVVMPVFNGAKYLRQALASIRWQTFTDWELVCVNDGSTDASGEILRQFAAEDARIRLLEQENRGIVGALNRGVQAARGPWIARMDSDDIALPQRLATQHEFVQQNPDCLAVGSDVLLIDPQGSPVREERYATTHVEIEHNLLTRQAGSLAHPAVLMHRDTVIELGMYRQKFQWIEDADLWLRLARHGRLANISHVLLHYRLHAQSISATRQAEQQQRMWQMLAEAHSERGLPAPAPLALPRRKRRSTAVGKWARQAARAGYIRTALTNLRHQIAAEPFSILTTRVAAETLARATVSFLAGKRPPQPELPDWRKWDCSKPDSHEPLAA